MTTSGRLDCSVSARCGGCPQIDVGSAEQRAAKRAQVSRALAAAGAGTAPSTFHPLLTPSGYRNRIRQKVGLEGQVGFFNSAKDLSCLVLEPSLRAFLSRLSRESELRPELFLELSHLELRAPDRHGLCGVLLAPGELPHAGARAEAEDRLLARAQGLSRSLGADVLVGLAAPPEPGERFVASNAPLNHAAWPTQEFALSERIYQAVPLSGFIQINHAQNRALVRTTTERARSLDADFVLDLFCGSGNFLLPLLAQGLEGVGVESNAASIGAARQAAEAQGLGGEWVADNAFDWLRRVPSLKAARRALAIVDPPRAGIGEAACELVRLGVATVLHLCCRLDSLERDLQHYSAAGYRARSATLFDMFAQTAHAEVLVELELS